MKVSIDQVWVTSQTLVCRVIIWGNDNAWRQKRYCSVPLEEVPEEAITSLYQWYLDEQPAEDLDDVPLF